MKSKENIVLSACLKVRCLCREYNHIIWTCFFYLISQNKIEMSNVSWPSLCSGNYVCTRLICNSNTSWGKRYADPITLSFNIMRKCGKINVPNKFDTEQINQRISFVILPSLVVFTVSESCEVNLQILNYVWATLILIVISLNIYLTGHFYRSTPWD